MNLPARTQCQRRLSALVPRASLAQRWRNRLENISVAIRRRGGGKTHQASVPHVYSRADCQIAHPDERCYEIADIPTLVGSGKQSTR